MAVCLLIVMIFVVIIVGKNVLDILKNRRKILKQRKIREVVIQVAPYIFDLEMDLKKGVFNDSPALKKYISRIVLLYTGYSENCNVKTSLNIKQALYEGENTDSKQAVQEIEKIMNEEKSESIRYALAFAYFIMVINHPFKYRLCRFLNDFKKNPLMRILSDFREIEKDFVESRILERQIINMERLLENSTNVAKF